MLGATLRALRPQPAAADAEPAVPIAWSLRGPWRIRLMLTAHRRHLEVEVSPAEGLEEVGEAHDALPVFNADAAGWTKGAKLRRLLAQECTTPGLLHPDSVAVSASSGAALTRGVDWEIDEQWGTIGRLEGSGALTDSDSAVSITYTWTPLRLDSLVLTADGHGVELRQGRPHGSAPPEPPLRPGERRLMNVWLPGRIAEEGLNPSFLFPVLDPDPDAASALVDGSLPRTLAKLRAGAAVSIVAWGDSVTDGSYLPSPADRWQEQFVAALRERFPASEISLRTEGWGGRSTTSYLQEPAGSPRHFPTCVLGGSAPDLVISEFVNDASLSAEQVAEQYGQLGEVFGEAGSEWAILSPHYVRPGPVEGWMEGLEQENGLAVEEDPRPYTAALRAFVAAADAGVALGDAARLWGQLYRHGLPYTTLLLNSINHPNRRGMATFAEALLPLFPAGA